MENGKVWIGLDLGERTTNVCAIDELGVVQLEQSCPTGLTDLKAVLAPFPPPKIEVVSVEAGTGTHIVRKLLEDRYPVHIFEARKARKFLNIRRNKTDSSDARGLADIGRLGQNTVSQVYLKGIECQELRSLLVMRDKLVQIRVAAEASLRSRLALYGRRLVAPSAPGRLRTHLEKHLKDLLAEERIDLQPELSPLVELCESLRSYLAKLDRTLASKAKQHPVCRLLMEVPGVGPICALSFYSAIEDPHRFRRVSDVGAYLGLTPRRYQSGEVSQTRGITKNGNKLTRTHLVTSASVLRRHGAGSELRAWALKTTERIGKHRARVALARKLAVVLLAMWKTGTHFQPKGSGRPTPLNA